MQSISYPFPFSLCSFIRSLNHALTLSLSLISLLFIFYPSVASLVSFPPSRPWPRNCWNCCWSTSARPSSIGPARVRWWWRRCTCSPPSSTPAPKPSSSFATPPSSGIWWRSFAVPTPEDISRTPCPLTFRLVRALWSKTAKNTDRSTGPLARPFACGTVNGYMAILSVFFPIFDHSGEGEEGEEL